MRRIAGLLCLVTAIVGALAGLLVLAPDRDEQIPAVRDEAAGAAVDRLPSSQPRRDPATERSLQSVAGRDAASRPATGEVSGADETAAEEPTDPAAPAAADSAKKISEILTHSHTGLVVEPVAGGGEKVHLQGRFGSAPIARRQPDGTLVIEHYRSAPGPED